VRFADEFAEFAEATAPRLRRTAFLPVEVLTDRMPETPSAGPSPETRLAVLAALATLPPKARAVVVCATGWI